MRVAFDNQAKHSGHSVRGIGMMIGEQTKELLKESKKRRDVSINIVDFSKANLSNYDIVHYPYFFPYTKTLPPQKPAKYEVVTIQDVIHLIYPKIYAPGLRGKINFYWQKMRLKKVDAIITISETSKKDIVRFLDINPDKIHVVYLAAKSVFKKISNRELLRKVQYKYKLPEKFVLYVGDVNYNKNVDTLVEACEIARIPLIIVGKQAVELHQNIQKLQDLKGPRDYVRYLFNIPHPEVSHFRKLSRLIRESNAACLGFVSDEDLACIYNLATIYCQPSFYEGFGLIVLEAFACETPVIISKTQALVEIAGDAAMIADPSNANDFASKIKELVLSDSTRIHYVRSGSERIKDFSWEKTARQMIEVYKTVANNS